MDSLIPLVCQHCGRPVTKILGRYVHDRGNGHKNIRCGDRGTVAEPRRAASGILTALIGYLPELRALERRDEVLAAMSEGTGSVIYGQAWEVRFCAALLALGQDPAWLGEVLGLFMLAVEERAGKLKERTPVCVSCATPYSVSMTPGCKCHKGWKMAENGKAV